MKAGNTENIDLFQRWINLTDRFTYKIDLPYYINCRNIKSKQPYSCPLQAHSFESLLRKNISQWLSPNG